MRLDHAIQDLVAPTAWYCSAESAGMKVSVMVDTPEATVWAEQKAKIMAEMAVASVFTDRREAER